MGLHLEINSAKSKIRFTTERHLPVVKVLPAEASHDVPTRGRKSCPASRWSVASNLEGTDQGIDALTDRYSSCAGDPVSVSSGAIRLWQGCRRAPATGGVGGDEETRTPDPLLAKEMLCQLSYVPLPVEVVGVSGLEPETSALSGQCSNQLS